MFKDKFCFLKFSGRVGRVAKKAIILVELVKESEEKGNAELEREIFMGLSKVPHVIPWMKKVVKVEVIEEP